MEICASKYDLSMLQMRGKTRKRAYVLARQLTMKIMHDEFNVPYTKIAKIITSKGMDHTTIIHGVRHFDDLLNCKDSEATVPYREAIIEVRKEIIRDPQIIITYDDTQVSYHEIIRYISKQFPSVKFEHL